MDLAAEFYLQTVETVFIRHALPKGEMWHRNVRMIPPSSRRADDWKARMTTSPASATEAAHDLCINIPSDRKVHYSPTASELWRVQRLALPSPRIADFISPTLAPRSYAACASRYASGGR